MGFLGSPYTQASTRLAKECTNVLFVKISGTFEEDFVSIKFHSLTRVLPAETSENFSPKLNCRAWRMK